MPNEKNLNTIPVGTLGLIPLESCATLGQKVNQYLTEWRAERSHAQSTALHFSEYSKDSYIVKAKNPRFGSGEAKGVIEESVRGCDLYLIDVYKRQILLLFPPAKIIPIAFILPRLP